MMENSYFFPEYKRRFGWFQFRPDCLQFLCKPEWALFFVCCGVFSQGFLINGLLHIVLPSLEKRFNLKSSEAGIIVGSYDLASITLLIPITYYGGLPRASRPLWYGTGMIILGVGAIIFTIPEMIVTSTIDAKTLNIPPLCNISHQLDRQEVCQNRTNRVSPVFWIFLSSNLICGAGGCILFTLAIVYIDDSVYKAKSALFIGIFYLSVVFGTASGFVIGGYFLQIRSTFFLPIQTISGSSRKSEIMANHENPEDASFHGAWWIGFILIGVVFIIISIPNLGFPAELPDAELIRESKASEANRRSSTLISQVTGLNIKGMAVSVFGLLKNPTFVFLSVAACCDSAIVNGSSVFLPKILENQMHLSSKTAAIIIGCVAGIGGIVGILTGGLIVKFLNLSCKSALKLCIYSSTVTCFSLPVVLLYCKERSFAGISVSYENNPSISVSFRSLCNKRCSCHEERYSPICGVDGVSYYSPCFAGCDDYKVQEGGIKEFFNCSCIDSKLPVSQPEATSKTCSLFCPYLIIFIAVLSCALLFIFIQVVPGITATLRCVDISQRSLAMGIQWLMIRACGILALSSIGKNIDSACLHWEMKCAEQGSCIIYDSKEFSLRLFFMAVGSKSIGLASAVISFMCYKPHVESLSHDNLPVRHS